MIELSRCGVSIVRVQFVQKVFPLVLLLCSVWFNHAASGDAANHRATVARYWNEEILAAIRIDLPNPPVHARNLFHLSVAMYDAWAAYDRVAVGYLYHAKHQTREVEEARREAIS